MYCRLESLMAVMSDMAKTTLIKFTLFILCVVLLVACNRNRGQNSPVKTVDYSKMQPIKVKFYLERSGSMTPFDAKSTKGDFKSAISMLLNNIPGNNDPSNLLYVVNDAVYSYNRTYKDFIQSKNIFADTKSLGDPRYTDFTCIFDSVLSRTNDNELSILVSDLIYSTKDMIGVTGQKVLNEANLLTRSVFKGHTDKMVLVIKMNGDYDGPYYTFQSPNKGLMYKGERPYYFVFVAKPKVMQRLFLDPRYKDLINFNDLQGYENYYCFSSKDKTVDYSVLLSNKRNRGRVGAVKGQTIIHEIEKIKPDRDDNVVFTIAADFSEIIVPDNVLLNPKNYDVSSLSGFKIQSIEPIQDAERDDKLRAIPNATHFVTLATTQKICYEQLTIKLKNELPKWIENSNTDDDTNLNASNFATTTFAFKYLMNGIFEAYYGTSEDPYYFTMNITINK